MPATGPSHLGLRTALEQVLTVLTEMPTHRFPNKSDNQGGLDVLQSMLNAHVAHSLTQLGWDSEVSAYTTRSGQPSRDTSDFGRMLGSHRLLMEVEFGNSASNERNLSKFMCAYRSGELDLAFYVLPTSKMASRIDSGVATYEITCKDLNDYPEGHVTCPLVVIGLDVDDQHTVDWSQSGLQHATQLSKTNGNQTLLPYYIAQYLRGVPLADITVPHEPSVQKMLKAVSRKMYSSKKKKASAGFCPDVEQLELL